MMDKVLTRNVGVDNSQTIDVYRSRGGYEALRKACRMEPAAIIDEVKASGLRGRGGAGFPCGVKWSFMPKQPSADRPHYLVCNADESEPGTFKDRLIMEEDPHLLIEGCMISARAIQASIAFIYIRGEYVHAARVLERAVAEARAGGFVGRDVLGSGWSCEMIVHRGAGAYICGEETALMDSLEGGRGNPRLKPPFPAQYGVYGMPTTVNNVETLACVPLILERGSDWFKSIGPNERNTGPKLYCMSGHIKRPGVYEAPMGVELSQLIDQYCGGMLHSDRKLKACIPGGSSVPVLTAEECEGLKMDFDSIAERGSMLGSAAVMIMDESTDMVLVMERISHFYAHESCGQCTPCREGTGWIEKILRRMRSGGGRKEDLDLLESVSGHMMGTTICPLADAAAMPCQSFVKKFRHEFEHYVHHGRSVLVAS
ncbi:MAG: NADH-quinone oxidoreductase subunit NuoF [Acidobacteriota bacterium]|nr:MAG: NADH-quinone oxidoreductase subunit NuoF [Acidobacteriota bacterium]